MRTKYLIITIPVAIFMLISACKKQDDFLNAVPSSDLAVIKNLNDVQLLLNNDGIFSRQADPDLGNCYSDEIVGSSAMFNRLDAKGQKIFTWADNPYPNQTVTEWNGPYNQIYNANIALEAVNSISHAENLTLANTLTGTALFYRAKAYFNLMQIFTMPYDSTKAQQLLGVPLRLSSNLNERPQRSNESVCYDQIISDLKKAVSLLPHSTGTFTQPTAEAACGYLARVYLSMSKYADAYIYADKYLAKYNQLTDYNTLPPQNYQVSSNYLNEDIFHSTESSDYFRRFLSSNINPELVNSYDTNDLRPGLFFYDFGYGGVCFLGTYDVNNFDGYSGIATDEIYLIRSECNVRLGRLNDGLKDLNALLVNRYQTGTFVPFSTNDKNSALSKIILERRKELIFRGLRWQDIRRLNLDPQFAKKLQRDFKGTTYSLEPNSLKYAAMIPDDEIKLSGIQQNPR